MSFFTCYFKNLPILLLASSAAVLIPCFIFVTAVKIFDMHYGDGLSILPLFFWGFGHLFAAPGLLLAFLPTVVMLQKSKNGFGSYVGFSTSYAFINGLLFASQQELLLVFIGVGFLTGMFFFLLIRRSIFGENPPEIPKWSFVVMLIIMIAPPLWPTISTARSKINPCSIDITTELAGVKLQVPRFYDLGQSKHSKSTIWGAVSFIAPNGDQYWPRQEDACQPKDIPQPSVIRMSYASYSDPNIYNGQYRTWIDRRIAEIEALGYSIEPNSDILQRFEDSDQNKTYLVLPTLKAKAASDKPVIIACDKRRKKRQCHTAYMNELGIVISYSLVNEAYQTEELSRINDLANNQLKEFVAAAKGENKKNAEFLIPEAVHAKSYDRHADECEGYQYKFTKDGGFKNFTIKIEDDYFRVLLDRNITSTVNVVTPDEKVLRDFPCDVDYIEGVSFSLKNKGSITSLNSWTLERQESLFQKYKKQFAEAEEHNGVKEIEIGKDRYRGKKAVISKTIIPTGSDKPAIVSCGKDYRLLFGCSITYQQQEHDVIVRYRKVYGQEFVENPDYLEIYLEAEKWVADMRNAAEEYHEKTGFY